MPSPTTAPTTPPPQPPRHHLRPHLPPPHHHHPIHPPHPHNKTHTERLIALTKAHITWAARDITTQCRERCGAHGLFPHNGIADLTHNIEGGITAEGDNLVILTKAAAEILLTNPTHPTPTTHQPHTPTNLTFLRNLLAHTQTIWHTRAQQALRQGPTKNPTQRWNHAAPPPSPPPPPTPNSKPPTPSSPPSTTPPTPPPKPSSNTSAASTSSTPSPPHRRPPRPQPPPPPPHPHPPHHHQPHPPHPHPHMTTLTQAFQHPTPPPHHPHPINTHPAPLPTPASCPTVCRPLPREPCRQGTATTKDHTNCTAATTRSATPTTP
ncbi:hypothetical protein [Streptomyces leeuwenhoekii]|uniref:acyl-CoA dehydrogenase family protein n=1 Tax=Streptomyces leeuwenhoekii TaxID=1437453 RepID=UPI003BF50816